MRYFEFNDKPAFSLRPHSVPFVLQHKSPQEKVWTPCYDAHFGVQAVPIGEQQFREMAGDMAQRMPTRI